jgi:DNA-binding transcriptional regulator YhcF (GntR family)
MPRNRVLYEKGILSIKDAAAILHVSYPTMRRIYDEEVQDGKFTSARGKERKITAPALVSLLKKRCIPVPLELQKLADQYAQNYC